MCRLWTSEERRGLDPRVKESSNPEVFSLQTKTSTKLAFAEGSLSIPVGLSRQYSLFELQPQSSVASILTRLQMKNSIT